MQRNFFSKIEIEKQVLLRKFPYPYQCALTISNDIEFFTWEAFIEVHRFLNTNKSTRLGSGLNLEIGDSFFMFSENPQRSFSYFDGLSHYPSRYASKMLELMRVGYLDTLHTFGDFDEGGKFVRKMAETAINELEKNNIKTEVWTGHGTVKDIQNIGFSGATYQQGDLLNSSAYHLDLTANYGIKFFCLDNCLVNKFGYNLIFPSKFPFNLLEEKFIGRARARNGMLVYTFKRFRGTFPKAPNSENIVEQLSEQNLNKLISGGLIVVIYQHLGAKRLPDGHCISNGFPYFSKENLDVLRNLADLNKKGTVFVTTTARLLNYYFIVNNLVWHKKIKNGTVNIEIEKVKDYIFGDYLPTSQQLAGITFYTHFPEKTNIYLKNKENFEKLEKVINGRDQSGMTSISIPWIPLKWPF